MNRHWRTALVGLALLSISVAGCGDSSGPATETYDSGIHGRATVDGGCPVIRQGEPCPDRPISADIQVTPVGSDMPIATVTSDEDGTFEVRVPPGDYVVSGAASDGSRFPYTKPVDVTVTAHTFTWVRVAFDTGIR